jgi:hypothetical protein
LPLSKTITDNRGVTATYWVAIHGTIDLATKMDTPSGPVIGVITYAMRGYTSKALPWALLAYALLFAR